MTGFRCVAIDTATAERFRQTGRDDFNNELSHGIADSETGYPCRHCLSYADIGEEMLLGSYNMPRPVGIYWTPSPIFVHKRACARYEQVNHVAPIVRRNAIVSPRSYDNQDRVLYDLGAVISGADIDAPLQRALSDQRTRYVNVHTARPGCLLTRIERLTTS